MSDSFPKTELNKVRRVPYRGQYDKETMFQILDDSLICHVGLIQDGQPIVIPTIVARDGDHLLLHGSSKSRLMEYAASGQPLCLTVTHLDGLVLARSVFHHSMNYRSVVVFGTGKLIDDAKEKLAAMKRFTEKLTPGRWGDARLPNANELKATSIVAIDITTGSAKVRVGPPGDDDEDYTLPVWAGVLPINQVFGEPIADPKLMAGVEMPAYIKQMTLRYAQGRLSEE